MILFLLSDAVRFFFHIKVHVFKVLAPTDGSLYTLAGDEEQSVTYLTLRRLVVWLAEPCRRMRLLACLADATADKEGGALAGAVHALAQVGGRRGAYSS